MATRKSEREDAFIGKWVSTQPFDTDDYLVEYTVKKVRGLLKVTARDYRDGERMKISDVTFNGHTLEFVSRMPSTGREGINRFIVKDTNTLTSEFTFKVVESLKRIDAQPLPRAKHHPATASTARRTMARRKI